MLVAVDGRPAGLIALADAPRPTAAAAVAALHDLGVEVVMLTGDNEATARRIADQLGIDTVIADVLPGDKAAQIAELQDEGRQVAMVGDGVNDAPALAQADLGIAIGAGTDVAIETADVVLMRSDPLDVPTALRIGRGTLRKMRQNLAWAVGYNAVALQLRRRRDSNPRGFYTWPLSRRHPSATRTRLPCRDEGSPDRGSGGYPGSAGPPTSPMRTARPSRISRTPNSRSIGSAPSLSESSNMPSAIARPISG